MKIGSDNTLEIVSDEGWSISMRIHSAESKVIPSLKFDVQLISLPHSVVSQVAPWGSRFQSMSSWSFYAQLVADRLEHEEEIGKSQ